MVKRYMDSIYHDMLMSEETQAIRREVRAFAEKEIAPIARKVGSQQESVDNFPWELIKKMGKAGLFGIPFGKEYGGRGLKDPACGTIVTIEELAYISNTIATMYDVQTMLAGNAVSYGSDYIKETYLKPLISGDTVGCFATTEPDASTDLRVATIKTTAEKQGDNWVINGRKRFITEGPVAKFVSALCKTGDTLTHFVIPLNSEGARQGSPDIKIGNKGQLTGDLYFDHVVVPDKNRVGGIGDGLKVSLGTLAFGRIGIGATGIGMAQSCFDEVVAYLKEREAFGKKIGQYQHWQFKLADWMTMIESGRNIVYKAARRRDEVGSYAEPETGMAKSYGTEVATTIARDAVQAFGGYGFMLELAAEPDKYFKVNEIYRDSKITEIYEGTNEIQKVIMMREIFDKGYLK